jgi:hypothetical protein
MLRPMTLITRSPIAAIGFVLLLMLGTGMVAGGSSGPWSDPGVQGTFAVPLAAPEVTWTPQTPGEGRLFHIMVQASSAAPISGAHGQVAGEELHFEGMGGGLYQSLAAVPVGSEGVIAAELRIVYESGAEERFTREIPIVAGVYAHERLSVAPRFGSAPDSADQAQLARDQAMAREVSRVSHRTPRSWGDAVVLPRNGRVTSGFGDGREFNGQISSRHMGLDLQGARGDTVVAAAAGTVALVEPFLLAGNIVYLNHGGGLLSAYFHLSRQLVAVGDTVRAGQPVGLVGATGRVTGPHLHWVVRYGRTSVDPRSLLDLVGAG